MQPNRAFASIDDAIRWLHRKVDDVAFDAALPQCAVATRGATGKSGLQLIDRRG
jgi:hypothetical protein